MSLITARIEHAERILALSKQQYVEPETLQLAQLIVSQKAAVASDAPDARLRRQHERRFQRELEEYFAGFLKRVRRNAA